MKALMAIAVNPNLSPRQVEQLMQEAIENEERLQRLAFQLAEDMPLEKRVQFLQSVLPMIAAF